MTDPEEERLTLPSGTIHPHFSSSVVSVPPFAPTPHYALNIPECDGNATYRTASTSTGRSGTLATTSHVHGQPTAKSDCNIHEVCHYFQQVVFVLAILTGIALVIAGSVMQTQTGELVVFVYIGALLISVNSALLSIQCYVRRKQKRRHRTHTASRSTVSAPPVVQQHAPNLQYSTVVPQAETRHYFVNHGPGGAIMQPFLDNHLVAGSPTESQAAKYYSSMHSMVSLHPGSVGSHGHHYHHHHHHHHQNKDKYHHQSPPLGQQVRSHGLHSAGGANVPLLPTPRSDLGPLMDGPPPSYTELARTGRLPPEGTTVHLL